MWNVVYYMCTYKIRSYNVQGASNDDPFFSYRLCRFLLLANKICVAFFCITLSGAEGGECLYAEMCVSDDVCHA